MVSGGLAFASPSMLRFRKPENFVPGNLSECLPHWEVVLKDYPKAAEIFRYVSQGVYVQEFFVPFNGTYRGRSYNTNVPPRMSFPNSFSCNNFRDFASQTILERVANGSLLVWGEVGKVDPPHLVMPITVEPGQPPMQSRGLWSEATRCLPIAVKEAQALFNTLESLCSDTHNARIDAFVDNMALLHSWERQVSKSSAMSDILKDIFSFTLSRNLSLNLMYVPSKDNPPDAPSRSLSDLDCSLSPAAWLQVDKAFGPHTIDLMPLPFNVQNNRAGCPLRFFSPFPCTQAFGVNVFAQDISSDENAYVFPPFVLIGPLLKYLRSQLCTFSIVVPDLCPRKFWWPLVQRTASSSFKLGSKGDADILLFPAKSGPAMLEPRPLQWDLWVFRIPSAS